MRILRKQITHYGQRSGDETLPCVLPMFVVQTVCSHIESFNNRVANTYLLKYEQLMPQPWNGVQFRSTHRPHVESYFLKLNSPDGKRALWIKATILCKPGSQPVAEAWAIAFERDQTPVGAKDTVLLSDALFGQTQFNIHVANVRINEKEGAIHLVGRVGQGSREIAFDLTLTPKAMALVPFPSDVLYKTPFPSSKFLSPIPHALCSGTYSVNGQSVLVDAWNSMQGHNWGKRHGERYAWVHCNAWKGNASTIFEGATACVKVGPWITPPMTLLCVVHEGVRYFVNAPMDWIRSKGEIDIENFRWTFRGSNEFCTIEGEFFSEAKSFACLGYENPDGVMSYCYNSKLANGNIVVTPKGRQAIELQTDMAALEFLTKKKQENIQILA